MKENIKQISVTVEYLDNVIERFVRYIGVVLEIYQVCEHSSADDSKKYSVDDEITEKLVYLKKGLGEQRRKNYGFIHRICILPENICSCDAGVHELEYAVTGLLEYALMGMELAGSAISLLGNIEHGVKKNLPDGEKIFKEMYENAMDYENINVRLIRYCEKALEDLAEMH